MGHPSQYTIPLGTDPPSALAMRSPGIPARSTPMGEEEELSGSYESGLSQNLIHCLSTTFSVILLADKPRHTNDFSGCINNVKIQLCGDMLCPTNCVHSHAASCKVT